MRLLTCALLFCATGSLAACGGSGAAITDNKNRTVANAPERPAANAQPSATPSAPSVASSHGGDAPAAPAVAAAERERTIVDTAALDAKIAKAIKKAKAPKARAADKKAAARAYLERGNVYWSAGNPSLYKFALADFKSVLVYEPGNAEAAAKRDEIIRIYRDMNRPVPELSNEK